MGLASQNDWLVGNGRRAIPLGFVALATGTVAACAGGPSFTGSVGACAPIQPDTITIHRTVSFRQDGFAPLDVSNRDAVTAKTVLSDFCAAEDHHEDLNGEWSCPADLGLRYSGAFISRGRTVATYDWHASGCQRLTLRIAHRRAASTWLVKASATAAGTLGLDFQHAIGAAFEKAIFEPPPMSQC
jgi:hypothetical protein